MNFNNPEGMKHRVGSTPSDGEQLEVNSCGDKVGEDHFAGIEHTPMSHEMSMPVLRCNLDATWGDPEKSRALFPRPPNS